MEKLKKLMELCKASVSLEINHHKDCYQDVMDYLNSRFFDDEDLDDDTRRKMIELDTIIKLQFYPNTPIGSYCIFHYDLDVALDAALKILGERGNDDSQGI